MTDIIEAKNLPEGEKIYLKKDFFGWRVVEPWKNPETGKINWFNFIFGGKKGLFFLIVLILLIGSFYLGVNQLVDAYKKVEENPCSFCTDCQNYARGLIKDINKERYTFSNLNLSLAS